MPNIGAPELIVILVIALLIIGPGKLPDVGAALGRSIREFRKASSDVQEAASIDAPPAPVAPAAPVAASATPASTESVAPAAPGTPAPGAGATSSEPTTESTR